MMFFQALIFTAALEFGGMFGGIFNYPSAEPITMLPLYTTMSADVEYNGLYVGGKWIVIFLQKSY